MQLPQLHICTSKVSRESLGIPDTDSVLVSHQLLSRENHPVGPGLETRQSSSGHVGEMQRRSLLQQHRRSSRINEIPRPHRADAGVAVLIAKYDDTLALVLAQDRLARGVTDFIRAVEAQVEDIHLHAQAVPKES
ncbi:hypothetical protein PG996_010751 [Apiospora saccharicola]|uniref:Uncharacterized protein n=1 Tax=Apiospora saccharicola TaxID=335842 RepID=A0ABR1UPI8_9PEZI